MCVLSFSVELRGAVGDASVRVWLDDSRVRDLHSEVEVPLVRKRNRWTARFEARGADPGATFWLRLAMAGRRGRSAADRRRSAGHAQGAVRRDLPARPPGTALRGRVIA